jgi:hypothetical protein
MERTLIQRLTHWTRVAEVTLRRRRLFPHIEVATFWQVVIRGRSC